MSRSTTNIFEAVEKKLTACVLSGSKDLPTPPVLNPNYKTLLLVFQTSPIQCFMYWAWQGLRPPKIHVLKNCTRDARNPQMILFSPPFFSTDAFTFKWQLLSCI